MKYPRSAPLVVVLALLASCGSGGTTNEATTTSSSSASTTSPTSTAIPRRCTALVELGCEGAAVERLQRLLRTRVDASVVVNGDFGDQTDDALRAFERLWCPTAVCTVDGEILVDGPEWQVLEQLDPLVIATIELSA